MYWTGDLARYRSDGAVELLARIARTEGKTLPAATLVASPTVDALARTIADLASADTVGSAHVAEAIGYPRDRVRAALQNANFDFPARKVTVNLAPADLPKESGRFDLPIALGILAASGQIPSAALDRHEFAGELALTGELRAVRGALAMVLSARTRSRASRTSVSGSPTMLTAGSPPPRYTSTLTGGAARPASARLRTTATDMVGCLPRRDLRGSASPLCRGPRRAALGHPDDAPGQGSESAPSRP